MPPKLNLRVAVVRLTCVALASYIAWPLFDMSAPRNPPDMLTPAFKSVRVLAPRPKPVKAATRETVIIQSEKALAKKLVVKEQKEVVLPLEPVMLTVEPVQIQPTPPTPPISQLVLTQPGLPSTAALPPIPPDDLPAPRHFNDKPGGSIVVLGVKLDSNNTAVMTDILVASNTPINDLALAMTTRGVQWKDVDPPIPAGEHRWVELRLDYASGDENNILP